MSHSASPKAVIQALNENYTNLSTLAIRNAIDAMNDRSESVVAEYGSDSSVSISSSEPSATSTPVSRSPIPFETMRNNMGGWSDEMDSINDSQSLTATNAQEDKAINQGYDRALESIKELDMLYDEPPPANALHRRHHNLDNALFPNPIDEETNQKMSSDEFLKIDGTYNFKEEADLQFWKKTGQEDIENQTRTTTTTIPTAVRPTLLKRYDLQHVVLAFALGSVVMGSYCWFWNLPK